MMKNINNKKIGLVALSAILVLALVTSTLPVAIAANPHDDNPNKRQVIDCTDNELLYNDDFGTTITKDADIRIPDGETCTIASPLGDVQINGDVIAGTGSTLNIYSQAGSLGTVHITGDVKTLGGHKITIAGQDGGEVIIDGSLQISSTADGIVVTYADIGGNAQFDLNMQYYSITNSHVTGSVLVKDNTSDIDEYGGIFNNFEGNTIDKNLQCSGNDPAPVSWGSYYNIVTGKAQGQCADLTG